MSATELLAGAGGSIKLIDEQILTASGNWTKVAAVKPTDRVIVEMWSGGGSGAKTGNAEAVGGGQGGNFIQLEFFAYQLGSSVPCVIGAGGAAVSATNNLDGNPGGASSFAGFSIPGGAGGKRVPGGLLQASTDIATVTNLIPSIQPINDPPTLALVANELLKFESGGFSYGSFSGAYVRAANRLYAGGCGGSFAAGQWPPSASAFGGAGGAGALSGSATSGAIPAGGGGALATQTGNTGAGARGEIRVRVLRGAS